MVAVVGEVHDVLLAEVGRSPSPVPAGGLVGEVPAVPVRAHTGEQVARPLAEQRAAGGRDVVVGGGGQAVEDQPARRCAASRP